MGFLRRFPISGIFVLRDVEHVFFMEGSRETKADGFLKKISILGHFLEVLEFRGSNLIMDQALYACELKEVRIWAFWSN